MALPPNFLDELRSRTPMPSLVGRRVRLTKSGRNWKGLCPFHNEKSPSFYVYDDSFHCFGCGAHGDAFAFIMRAEGGGFMEAVERLAGEAGLEVPKASPEAAARERRAKDLYGVLQAAEAAYARRLRSPEGAEGLAYLKRRGLTDETIARFGLGWSGAGRGALLAELREEGIEQRQLIEAGLMQERDEGRVVDLFFNRVMFPIRDRRGRTISFGGRILGDGQPKYVNGPETVLFSKRRNLYGLDLAREGVFRGARLIVAEGYMDVIALHQAGFTGAVAPLGTALTEEQFQALWQVSPEPVLCLDGDAAGQRAAARAAEVAMPLVGPSQTLNFVALPLGDDPDSILSDPLRGKAYFQRQVDDAAPLEVALFNLVKSNFQLGTALSNAAFETELLRLSDLIKNKPYRKQIKDAFFKLFREATKSPWPKKSDNKNAFGQSNKKVNEGIRQIRIQSLPVNDDIIRPGSDIDRIKRRRARILFAICINHPDILLGIQESLAQLDLPDEFTSRVRDALITWCSMAPRLDSQDLIAHLGATGIGSAVDWVFSVQGLPAQARSDAQPKEALDAFWQFYGFLRGEAELVEDARAAQRALAATNDPAAQTRLIRLTEALDALRRGEAEEADAV